MNTDALLKAIEWLNKSILKLSSYKEIHPISTEEETELYTLKIVHGYLLSLQSQPLKEDERYIEYLKAEHDFQLIQLDGLNISKDQSFEQRINTAIMMAWKAKGQSVEPQFSPNKICYQNPHYTIGIRESQSVEPRYNIVDEAKMWFLENCSYYKDGDLIDKETFLKYVKHFQSSPNKVEPIEEDERENIIYRWMLKHSFSQDYSLKMAEELIKELQSVEPVVSAPQNKNIKEAIDIIEKEKAACQATINRTQENKSMVYAMNNQIAAFDITLKHLLSLFPDMKNWEAAWEYGGNLQSSAPLEVKDEDKNDY